MKDTTTEAVKWLEIAIRRHERHMMGTEPTDGDDGEISQKLMMEEMTYALQVLEGEKVLLSSFYKENIGKFPDKDESNKDDSNKMSRDKFSFPSNCIIRMKDYIAGDMERRFFVSEVRASKENRTVEGYAAMFDSPSELFPGNWQERIAPGAFEEVLKDDTVALFNHDPNFILARNGVNMTLTADKKGLIYRFEAPNTTVGNDLLENLRNGNVRSSSFAFTVEKESWEYSEDRSKPSIRTIEKVKRLYDVSPVTYPAYPETSVGLRNFEALRKEYEAKKAKEEGRSYKMAQIKRELEILKLKHK